MAEIEETIAEKVADELDAGDVPAAPSGMTTLHGGPGTAESLNYSPGSSASGGGVAGLHEGAGTRPLAGTYVSPTGGADGAAAAQERDAAYAAVVAQVKIDRANSDASLRRFHRDPVVSSGYVEGLENLERRVK